MSGISYYLKRILLLLLLLALLIGCAVYFFWDRMPYQNIAEREIGRQMKVMGLSVSNLKVGRLGRSEAVIESVAVGEGRKSEASGITAGYDWQEVQRGYVRQVGIASLTLRVYETESGWFVAGLEPLMQQGMAGKPSPSPVFQPEMIRQIAPKLVEIDQLQLDITGQDFTAQADGKVLFNQAEKPNLTLEVSDLKIQAQHYQLVTTAAKITAVYNSDKKQWKGKLTGNQFELSGAPEELPPLKARGDFSVTEEKATATLSLQDNKKEKKAVLALNLPLGAPENGKLQLKNLALPWGGGIIETENVYIALSGKKPIRIPLQLDQVDLAELLKTVAEDQVKGTGRVSGMVPVIYQPDGKITLEPGAFEALQAGQISVSPELLPEGTREDLDMVRAALSDFRYDSLKISVLSGADGKPTIQLAVEGSNPQTFEGRKIKLNVNLTGDILSLLQQSILPIEDAKELLKLQEKP